MTQVTQAFINEQLTPEQEPWRGEILTAEELREVPFVKHWLEKGATLLIHYDFFKSRLKQLIALMPTIEEDDDPLIKDYYTIGYITGDDWANLGLERSPKPGLQMLPKNPVNNVIAPPTPE